MSAYPNIIDTVGSYDPVNGVVTAMVLFTNSGGNGYIITNLYDSETHILKETRSKCYGVKTGLAYKNILYFVGVTNHIDASVGGCTRGESCDPPSCSEVNITGTLRDMPVYMADYMTPQSPTGVDVISGDGQLTFIWNKNENIFTYFLVLTDPSLNVVDSGYLPNYMNTHAFGNLTNGITYTLHIYNINQSNTPSSEITKAGIPAGATIPPTPTITPTPTIPPGTTVPPREEVPWVWIGVGVLGAGALIYLLTRK